MSVAKERTIAGDEVHDPDISINQVPILGSSFSGEPPIITRDLERRAEIEEREQAIINDYTAHDLWVKRHSPSEVFVDVYAVKPRDPSAIKPIDTEETLDRFREHRAKIDELRLLSNSDWVTIAGNLDSVIIFQKEKERVARGEPKMPFYDLHEGVNGYRPTLIPEPQLERDRNEMLLALRNTGVWFDQGDQASINRAYARYVEANKVHTRGAVEETLYSYSERFKTHLTRVLGEDLGEVAFKIIWKYQNQFWKFWERPDPDGDYLWGNWHSRHVDEYDRGIIEMYGYHELAHFLVAFFVAKQIKEGKLSPAIGVFPIPSRVGFQLEGVAQTIARLASLPLNTEGKFAEAKYRTEKRSVANALYEIEVLGRPLAEVAQKHQRYQVFNSIDKITQSLEEGVSLPFERGYTRIYGDSDYEFMQVTDNLREEARARIQFLRKNIKTPMGRDQIRRIDLGQLLYHDVDD